VEIAEAMNMLGRSEGERHRAADSDARERFLEFFTSNPQLSHEAGLSDGRRRLSQLVCPDAKAPTAKLWLAATCSIGP
jgi:hypothetical protein